MSKAGKSIRRGLEQAIQYAGGEAAIDEFRVHVPATVDVTAIRRKLKMTQRQFVLRFGFSVETLRH